MYYDVNIHFLTMSTDSCSQKTDYKSKLAFVRTRKLNLLSMYRDSLERRISAVDASIETLKQQIQRDQED